MADLTSLIRGNREFRGITISSWYTGVKIPAFSQKVEISKFVTNTLGLMVATIKRKYSSLPKVYLADVPTACIDFDKNEVLLSLSYIDPDQKKRINPKKSEHESLTALVGSIIHELAHFQHTKISFEHAFQLAGIKVSKNNQAIYMIANLVEDLYIDKQCYNDFAYLRWAMDCRVDYFFSKEYVEEYIKLIPTTLNTVDDFGNMINALFCLKNFNLRSFLSEETEHNKLFTTVCNMFLRSLSLSDLKDRMKLTKEIFDFMFKNIEMNGDSEEESDGEDGDKGDVKGSKGNKKPNKGGDNKKDGSPAVNGGDKDDAEKGDLGESLEELNDPKKELSISFTVSQGEDESVTVKLEIENFNVSLEKKETNKPGNGVFTEAKNPITIKPDNDTLKSLGFKTYNDGSQSFKVGKDEKFLEFGALMNAKTNVNKPFGQQSNRGRNIRQLTRILTDQKIFAEPVELQHIGKQSILVLLDCSGSMNGRYKIDKAATASVGTVVGLENARHNVCLLGHTADVGLNGVGNCDLVIYELKDFNEPASVAEERLNVLSSYQQTLANNADDNALLQAATYFDKLANPGKKTIIVFSDGQPSSNITQGTGATKKIVEHLRATTDINIVSISIDKSAIEPNNTIYGNENNFFSEDPSVVIKVIEQITGALSF